MSNRGYGSSGSSYWVRVRTREQREIAIHGGTKHGGGRRRVTRWSKWTSHRAADNATGALSQLEAVKKLNPLSDVQVFLAGKIVTIEQLNARAREESGRAMYGDEWCNACDARARAGFDDQCPACANERARSGGVG
jgi:hypothetical protein